jgi:hypothetical protein
MSTHTTHREDRPNSSGAGALSVALRGAQEPMPPTEPVLHVMTRDEYRSMTTPQAVDPLITTMRMVGRTVRLLFSRQEPERARALAMELARSSSPCSGLDDPVRNWEPALQLDRGLGRARRLQRLVNSPVWQNEHGTPRSSTTSTDSAADYLFATVMNLTHQTPLSDEALLFRLWYLAMRAVDPPENATRLFGELRQLPAHQQLAAGARMLSIVGTGALATTPSRPQQQPPHAVALPLPTQPVLDCRVDDH